MFYLKTQSTHFIYGYMASDSERDETNCCHMCYSFWLAAWGLLYAPSHRQDSTYHGQRCGALAGMRNSSMGSPHEGSIRPIAPWVDHEGYFIHRQDDTYHSLSYTSRGALAGTRNSSMGRPWRIFYPQTGWHIRHIPQPLLHQSWSTGWKGHSWVQAKTMGTS